MVPRRSKLKGHRPDEVRKRTRVTSDHPHEVELDLQHPNPVDLAAVRQQVTNLVGDRALEVVQQTLDQIRRGNYQAMKYLFEMVGLFPALTSEDNSAEDSLTKTLLNYLGVSEGSSSSIKAAQHDHSEKVDADAVK